MPTWPSWWWSSSKDQEGGKRKDDDLTAHVREAASSIKETAAASDVSSHLRAFTTPQTLIATAVLTTVSLGLIRFYRSYLRRIPEATNIKQNFFRKRSILGKVTSVGDGDNFRIYHTPGGWLAGWGWMPGRKVPTDKKELKNQTVHIRIAGIDAPELAHFGRPAQPYGEEALRWLTAYLQGRRIRAYLHRADQYGRVVATVYVWKGIFRRDVGLSMIKSGLATVYEAKTGAEFGEGLEQKYRNAEWWAKTKRKGMWAGSKASYESPREYKTRFGTGSPEQKDPTKNR